MQTSKAEIESLPSTCGMVGALRSRLAGLCASYDSWRQDIQTLHEILRGLDEGALATFERRSAFLRPALTQLLESLAEADALTPELRRDLVTITRGARCLVDGVMSGSGWSLSDQQCAVRYARIDVSRLVEDTCASFEALAVQRGIDFRVSAPRSLRAEMDERKTQLVLLNLLFNAFKYSPPQGVIECALTDDADAGELSIEVSDQGPPVAPEDEEAIFKRSRQLDRSISLRVGGLDLSLGTSRDLVALQGGTLKLERRGDRVSSFRARLPRHAPKGVRASSSGRGEQTLAAEVADIAARQLQVEAQLSTKPVSCDERPLILVVDDSRAIQRVLRELLQPDFNTVSAFDGAQGLRQAKALQPDLILTDVVMPQVDGEAMIRAVRATPELDAIPILVLTGANDSEQTVRLLRLGAQDVLRKPFVPPEVHARVSGLIASKHAKDVLGAMLDQQGADLDRLVDDVARHEKALQETLEELRLARDEAERANRIKSNFLRMMSHELKTPITAMQLRLKVIERTQAGLNPTMKDALRHLAQANTRLVHMVDTCIEWARVESGRWRASLVPFSLPDLLQATAAELEADRSRQEARIGIEQANDVPQLVSDERIVRLAALNLLGYALRNSEKSQVQVRVGFFDGCHRVEITDWGPPIPPEQRESLFSTLSPEGDLAWQPGAGSGLGLYVVRDLASAIDGEVALQSSDDGGNHFVLKVPSLDEEAC